MPIIAVNILEMTIWLDETKLSFLVYIHHTIWKEIIALHITLITPMMKNDGGAIMLWDFFIFFSKNEMVWINACLTMP